MGGAAAAILLLLLAWLLWRRRNRRRNESGYMDKPPLDLTGDEIRPFRNSTTPPADGPAWTEHPSTMITTEAPYGQHPSASTTTDLSNGQGSGNTSAPYLTMIPPPPPSSHTSYPPSSDHARSPFVDPYAVGTQRQDRSTTFTASEAGTFGPPPPASDPSPITQSYKSLATAVPFTARRPSTLASSEESTIQTPSRIFVPGREMDAGPLGPTSEESHELEMLPPDYHQATEPLPGQRPESRV